jgi:response regulator RpfG family c-di-GMP phosphodiesterase
MSIDNTHINKRILLVDDEPNVLKALYRALQPLGFELITASSGAQALKSIEKTKMNAVLTDMRMPGMDGSQLLTQIAEHHPDSRRMILTGYSDLNKAIASINEGKVHRFMTKPWDNAELRNIIRDEVDISLETLKSNEIQTSLAERSEQLESKVALTSCLLGRSSDLIRQEKYKSVLEIYGQLIHYRFPRMKDFDLAVTRRVKLIAEELNQDVVSVDEFQTAAQLHRFGLLVLPGDLASKGLSNMNRQELELYKTYPILGEQAIQGEAREDPVASIIRHHREWFNGNGFPDRLVAHYIPLGSRIIHVASDYERVKCRHGKAAALRFIELNSKTRYDPAVADILVRN